MINDLYAWKKVYKGPFKEKDARNLANGIAVNLDVNGIYGIRIKKARFVDMYDVYAKIEKELSPHYPLQSTDLSL